MTRQFFAPIGNGLGDVIVALPVVRELIERGQPTYMIANSQRQLGLEACIPGLAGIVPRPELQAVWERDGDTVYDFRSHPLQTDYVWGSAAFEEKFPGIHIVDILKMVCADFGINADFS